MTAGGARDGAGRKRRFINPSQLHAMVSKEMKAQVLCMIEMEKEDLADRRVSVSMLVGALLQKWMQMRQERYIQWATNNLSWIHNNYREEFNRLAFIAPQHYRLAQTMKGAFSEEYIISSANSHKELLWEREEFSDEFADDAPGGLI